MLQKIFLQGDDAKQVEIIEEYTTKSNEGMPMVVDIYIPNVKLAIEYLRYEMIFNLIGRLLSLNHL